MEEREEETQRSDSSILWLPVDGLIRNHDKRALHFQLRILVQILLVSGA